MLVCLEGMPEREIERPATIGGGEWSAKDLVGHIAAWERLALEVVQDWRGDRGLTAEELAPDLQAVDRLNAREVERRRAWSLERVLSEAGSVHAGLVDAIRSVGDEEWAASVDGRTQRALGDVLGRLLGAPRQPFAHVAAHLPDLERFCEAVGGRP
jgi:hypothetical protein